MNIEKAKKFIYRNARPLDLARWQYLFEYPHAPWWNDTSSLELNYNPTACFIGFILKYASKESKLYATAVTLLKEAYDYFNVNFPMDSIHTVSCFVSLYEYLHECNACIEINMAEFEELLKKQIKHVLTQDTSVWSTEYVCKPSLFISSQNSVFYQDNKELCDFECDFISKTQEADGSWNITWEWGSYPEQWSISKNWWKSDLIIKNLKFYVAFVNAY